MDTILALLLSEPTWAIYGLVGLVILLEGALPAGMVLPGEATALVGGATVALGHSELLPMVLVVVAAATLGDGIGFQLGSMTGTRLLSSRVLRSRRQRIEHLQTRLAHRGGVTLVAARWTAFVRSIVPALAGASAMPYRRFAPWNALGTLTWGTTSVALGALAGRSYAEVDEWLGGGSAVLLLVAVIAAGLVTLHRRRAVDTPAPTPVGEVVLAA